MQGASPLHPFDLHVLSTPPAFILSQNQTLEFNCLKPVPAKSTDGSNLNKFSLSLLTLYLSTICSKKLTETAFCVTKNRFFLILFLICVNRTTVRHHSFHGNSLSIITQTSYPRQAIFTTFFAISQIFSRFACVVPLAFGQLDYINTIKIECQLFYAIFFAIF